MRNVSDKSCLENRNTYITFNTLYSKIVPFMKFIHSFIHSFTHPVFCPTTGPKPPPKRFLHTVRSTASSFKWEYPLLSLRSSSSIPRLLPRLLVTSISPFIFPSIACFRRQFHSKMWVYETMWEKYWGIGQGTDDNTAHAHCVLNNTHSEYVRNTYCFPMQEPTSMQRHTYIACLVVQGDPQELDIFKLDIFKINRTQLFFK